MRNNRIVHIRAANVNLVAPAGNIEVFLPYKGRASKKLIVLNVIAHLQTITGTISTAPQVTIDNGTDGQNIVAAVALGTTPNRAQFLTVIGSRIVDSDNPLRLKKTVLADGTNPVFKADFEIVGIYK